MKNSMKKISVCLITAALIASTAVASTSVFAATGGTITVTAGTTGVDAGDTLAYYKVASLNQNGTYEWTWNADAFGGTVPTEVSAYDLNNGGVTNTNVQHLASILASSVKGTGTEMTEDTENNGFKADLTEDGYYLVVATSKTDSAKIYQPMLIEVKNGETCPINQVKVSEIGIDKKITAVAAGKEDTDGQSVVDSDGKFAQAKIGDTVTYTLTTQIPKYDVKMADKSKFVPFTITDTPTNLDNTKIESVVLSKTGEEDKTLTVDTDYTVTDGTAANSKVITIDRDNIVLKDGDEITDNQPDGVADYAGWTVTVTVTAKLATSAFIESANPNTATVRYGTDYITGGNATTKDDHADVYTTALKVEKYYTTGNSGNPTAFLAGATFELTQNGKLIERFTTEDDGTYTVKGLSKGTYVLTEKAAPAGYKLDSTPRTIVIKADMGEQVLDGATVKLVKFDKDTGTDTGFNHTDGQGFDISIENTPGQQLPGTGGMGTTLFTVGGISVVAVAGALLVIYMKKKKVNE